MRLGVEAALVEGRLVRGDVAVDEGEIAAVGLTGAGGRGIAAPGFVDLQVNGFAGVDLAGADAAGYARAGEALLATGVTAYQPTFVTAPEAVLVDALRAVPRRDPRIIGAHVEGPFLSRARAGAHPVEHLRAPEPALLGRLLAAGPVTQVTLAPELPGALALIDVLVAHGVVAACGHSDATAAEAHAAFDRGARTVTHLFNAMRPATHRDPGIALAALARRDVTVQVIADGHHLAPETLAVAWQAAAGRLALVTDATGAATLGTRPVRTAGGRVTTPEGTLAGSALTMAEAVRNLHAAGAPLEAALTAASAVPAAIAGRRDLGRLAPGARADVVVLDDHLEVRTALVRGAAAPRTM